MKQKIIKFKKYIKIRVYFEFINALRKIELIKNKILLTYSKRLHKAFIEL